ncbi:LCP family protein [Rhabdothermincola salaria]|uniref:LCP family protein n=1 Tax=Rhabdothermincola salaria TaxID=2903142 RepID=UPI001E62642A|nr:LCP family protein [Rhabdothermincola salaria]
MRRPHRTWSQRLLLTFNSLLVIVCLVAAGGLTWTYAQASDLPRIDLGRALSEPVEGGEPQNVLLVGIDNGDGLEEGDPVLFGRTSSLNTDTIMVLRIDPRTKEAAILSIPRDLYVPLAGGGRDRINAALALGGPERLIETIRLNFDIPINHYAMVDFAGFRSLVDAVGGVPVYFPWEARDQKTGLFQYDPGCVTLDADQALAFARSRSFEIKVDGRWRTDPTGDFGRIDRQQLFITAALEKAVARGVRNPFVLQDLIGVAQQNVTLDSEYTVSDIVSLGTQFRDFDPQSLATYRVPGEPVFVGAASVVELNATAAEPIFEIFRGAAPPEPEDPTGEPGTEPEAPAEPATPGIGEPSTTSTTTSYSFLPEAPPGVSCG